MNSDQDESTINDRLISLESSSRSMLTAPVAGTTKLSKSLLRAISPSRSLIELINPLHISHSHLNLGNVSKIISKDPSPLSSPSKSDNNTKPTTDAHDCGKPVSNMAKSIVTMLTAASMYAGMELENHTNKKDELDVNDDIENQEDEDGKVLKDDDDAVLDDYTSIDDNSVAKNTLENSEIGGHVVEKKIEEEDNGSIIPDDEELKTDTDTDSTIHNWTGSTDLAKQDSFQIKPLRRQSTLFELSVVHKLASSNENKSTSTLRALAVSKKLKTTFALDDNEEFISDYSCWLLRDVLLQGHLYLTGHHLLYFAFLPRKQGKISMDGSIGMKTNRSRRTVKKWAVLRDSTLSIYSSSTDLYFPYLTIDLQYALRAELVHKKHESRIFGGGGCTNKESSNTTTTTTTTTTWFKLLTESGSYLFHADSLNTANGWVASLKKHIFAARNKGDHVTIKIPLRNILDLELTPIFENSQTLRLKVLESSDSYAVDDYFLMFLYGADKAVNSIKEAMKQSGNAHQIEDSQSTLSLQIPKEHESATDDDDYDDDNNNDLEEEEDDLSDEPIETPTSPISPTRSKFHPSSLISRALVSPRMHSSHFHKLTKSLSPSFGSKDLSTESTPSILSSNSVVEKVVRYDNDDVPEIVLNDQGNVKQSNDSSPSSEGSDFLPVDRVNSPTPNGFSLETDVNELDKIYQNQQSKWIPKTLVKGVYNSTSSGLNHVTNLSTMWSSNPMHYDEINSLERGSEDPYLVKSSKERVEATQRFQKHFSLSLDTKLVSSYYAHFIKNVPVYGKIYLGDNQICYRSLLPGTNTLMILPFKDIENVYKEKGFRFGYSGLVIVIHGHEELFFEFGSSESRDDCEILLLKQIDIKLTKMEAQATHNTTTSTTDDKLKDHYNNNNYDDVKLAESQSELSDARVRLFESKLSNLYGVNVPIILENNPYIQTDFKPKKSYRFTLLTIGSRGDVQPYIALAKGLLKEGHQVKIVTHQEFQPWIEQHGINFAAIAGDPAELMSLMVTHGTMSVSFLKDASSKFRGWINDLLATSWESCQDSDILIESPSAMAGVHIAEALGIPYMRAFTMPWTKTRAYPHAFIVPDQKRGGSYNYLTHVMFENVFWRGISGQVNKWRVETLKLPKTNLEHMLQSKIPFLYNISPTVFPPSLDFASWIKVTGYWFLDEAKAYEPPVGLVEFIKQAREDKKKLIYIGFGSIVVSDPKELTEAVVNAVVDTDVRCILNKGWANRLGSTDSKKIEVPLPRCIYNAGSVPHDWLFGQIDAAVHHGGSGTTGATLRAGLPTIIKPFFGDQFFYANRVVDIGAGLAVRKLNSKSLGKLIKEATTNQRIIQKAKDIGLSISKENGVTVAIDTIYSQLEYAKNLIIEKKELYGPNLDKRNEELEEAAISNEESWLVV